MNSMNVSCGSKSLPSTSHVLVDISNRQTLPPNIPYAPQNFQDTAHNISTTPIDLSLDNESVILNSSLSIQNSDGSLCEILDVSEELLSNNIVTIDSAEINSNLGTESHSRLENYVYQVLMTKDEGPFIIYLYDYESNEENYKNLIDSKKRSFFSLAAVSKILIWHECRRSNSYEISPNRLDKLAESASHLFPRYLKTTLYSKPTETSNAHGALQSAYEGIREKLIACNYIKRCHRKRKSVDNENNLSVLEELRTDVEIIDDAYVEKWKCTASEEKLEFFQRNDAKTILQTFPNLRKSVGYKLIQADFCKIFNKPIDIFNANWPEVALKIIKLAKSKKHDKQIKEILRIEETALQGNSELLALCLIPFLFKKIIKQTVRSKSGKNWYPEKQEILNTFILHIKDTTNFTQALAQAKGQLQQMHVDHKLILQPYVVIGGATLSNITSAYVIVGDNTYQVHSALHAVDICFQFFKVLHEPYPHVCCHVWQFLEKLVYEFPLTNLYKGTSELIQSLNNLQ